MINQEQWNYIQNELFKLAVNGSNTFRKWIYPGSPSNWCFREDLKAIAESMYNCGNSIEDIPNIIAKRHS